MKAGDHCVYCKRWTRATMLRSVEVCAYCDMPYEELTQEQKRKEEERLNRLVSQNMNFYK